MSTCRTCQFWTHTNFWHQGKCKASAPIMVKLIGHGQDRMNGWQYSAQWPRTDQDELQCGAYLDKDINDPCWEEKDGTMP